MGETQSLCSIRPRLEHQNDPNANPTWNLRRPMELSVPDLSSISKRTKAPTRSKPTGPTPYARAVLFLNTKRVHETSIHQPLCARAVAPSSQVSLLPRGPRPACHSNSRRCLFLALSHNLPLDANESAAGSDRVGFEKTGAAPSSALLPAAALHSLSILFSPLQHRILLQITQIQGVHQQPISPFFRQALPAAAAARCARSSR